jgi:hypothetical protein
MITGWPLLSIIAIHGYSFHVHYRHTKSDGSSEARAAELPLESLQHCTNADASALILFATFRSRCFNGRLGEDNELCIRRDADLNAFFTQRWRNFL